MRENERSTAVSCIIGTAMGTFVIDTTTEPGVMRLSLDGHFDAREMREFVQAHNAAVDGFGRREYRVWCDVSKLKPLSLECAEIFEQAKRHSASRDNFMGSAVLVASAIVAMQHRRTSVESGVMSTELISSDEAELRAHLRSIRRKR